MARFLSNENGATVIEYGLIAGLIAIGLIGVLQIIGGGVIGLLAPVVPGLQGAGN
jgi:pilus assembly protein Flp/PilA